MAAAANIVLADAQVSPVNHTFIPLQPDADGTWWFEDQSGTDVLGYWKISVRLVRPPPATAGTSGDNSRMAKVIIGVHMPVLETISTSDAGYPPPPRVSYITRSKIELFLPERSTLQNRKDIRKLTEKVLADAQVIAAAESLQAIW